MGVREKLEWFGRMTMMIFILASVAFLSAITAMRFAIQGREVVVPNVTGKPAAQASSLLRAAGLGLKIEDRVYNDLPVDIVVRQSPPANTKVKVGEWVHAVLSLGPQTITIPSLENRSLRAAQIELLSEGLQTGEISSAYLPAFPPDIVLEQDPASGSTNATSPHVDLLDSLGPPPLVYVMPDFKGLPLTEAEARIAAAGLKLSKVTPMPLTGAPAGTVTSQLPVRGSPVKPGADVEFQVAE